VNIEYEPSVEEGVAAVRRQLWRVGNTRKQMVIAVVLLLAGAIILAFGGQISAFGWVGIGGGLLILLSGLPCSKPSRSRGAEQAVRKLRTQIMDFSDEGVHIQTKDRKPTFDGRPIPR